MTDWTNLPNQAVGVGGLPSGTTVTALRDNPVAIAEGAPGAPRVEAKGRAFEYLPFVNGSGTTASGWTNLDPLSVVILDVRMTNPAATQRNLQIRASADGGVNYGPWINTLVTSSGLGSRDYGILYVFMSAGLLRGNSLVVANGISENLGVTNINALQVRGNNSDVSAYVAIGRAVMRDEI